MQGMSDTNRYHTNQTMTLLVASMIGGSSSVAFERNQTLVDHVTRNKINWQSIPHNVHSSLTTILRTTSLVRKYPERVWLPTYYVITGHTGIYTVQRLNYVDLYLGAEMEYDHPPLLRNRERSWSLGSHWCVLVDDPP